MDVTSGLARLDILLIEDDPDSGDLLALALEKRGAQCRVVESGLAAMRELTIAVPKIILCDLVLPDGSGLDWLPRFRTIPGIDAVPAVALSGRTSEVDRERSLAAGFEKHLNKPASIVEIVATSTTLTMHNGPLSLKPMLYRLSSSTGCRYTSLLRFDGEKLTSVWTYDRARPNADPFPLHMPVEASYCKLVLESGEMVVIDDARSDRRVDGHVRQHQIATYIGMPVFNADGTMFGTLCSYNEAPVLINETAKGLLIAAAREIELALQSELDRRLSAGAARRALISPTASSSPPQHEPSRGEKLDELDPRNERPAQRAGLEIEHERAHAHALGRHQHHRLGRRDHLALSVDTSLVHSGWPS